MTLKGLFAVWRVNALDPFRFDTATLGAARSDLPSVVAALCRRRQPLVTLGLPLAIAGDFRALRARAAAIFAPGREMIVGGVVIGAVIVGGWYVSGHIGHLAEDHADARGSIRGHQFGQSGVILLCRAGCLSRWSS